MIMELIIGVLSLLIGTFTVLLYVKNRIKFWHKERKNYLYKSSTILTCCIIGVVVTLYALGGFIMILAFGHVTLTDDWSPFTNKLVFGFFLV